jgi:hypothetical protein
MFTVKGTNFGERFTLTWDAGELIGPDDVVGIVLDAAERERVYMPQAGWFAGSKRILSSPIAIYLLIYQVIDSFKDIVLIDGDYPEFEPALKREKGKPPLIQ